MGTYMHGQALKSAGIDPELLDAAMTPEPPGIAMLQTSNQPIHHARQVSLEEQDAMIKYAASTGSIAAAEDRYQVARGYLRTAMKRRFGSNEAMKNILLSLVTENAVAVQMVAQEKIGELSAPQAVFAGKLLVDTMEKIEKSISNTPKTVNFAQLDKVGSTLATLRAIVEKKPDAGSPSTGNG